MATRQTPAQYIKVVLKKYFPKDKFSCTYSSYSMGDSVDISWEDWPARAAVDQIVKQFQAWNVDSYTDTYEYNNQRTDIPQAKFVRCQRKVSKKVIDQVAKIIDANLVWHWEPHMKAIHVNDMAERLCDLNYIPTGKKVVKIDYSTKTLTFA